jgi:hypothetical protein
VYAHASDERDWNDDRSFIKMHCISVGSQVADRHTGFLNIAFAPPAFKQLSNESPFDNIYARLGKHFSESVPIFFLSKKSFYCQKTNAMIYKGRTTY